jgi:L-aminopeptidase/D-esterase-like protein
MASMTFDAITDVPGIKVGHYTDLAGLTGCTVVLCEAGVVPGVDVRGGAPGTIETDLMRPGNMVNVVHAIVLAGGSAFGLATQTGVVKWLEEHGAGLEFGGQRIPIVPGAIIFDLGVGDARARPGVDAGYAAAEAARNGAVEQGSVGAGTGATVAKLRGPERRMKGGVGTASETLAGGVIVGALVVVNAVGEIFDSSTGKVIAGPRGDDGAFMDTMEALRLEGSQAVPGESTTIGVIATNARIDKEQANRLAAVAHNGLSRSIRPVHTLADGDTLFALATGEVPIEGRQMLALEAFAAHAVERAVLKAIKAAKSLGGVPSVGELK